MFSVQVQTSDGGDTLRQITRSPLRQISSLCLGVSVVILNQSTRFAAGLFLRLFLAGRLRIRGRGENLQRGGLHERGYLFVHGDEFVVHGAWIIVSAPARAERAGQTLNRSLEYFGNVRQRGHAGHQARLREDGQYFGHESMGQVAGLGDLRRGHGDRFFTVPYFG